MLADRMAARVQEHPLFSVLVLAGSALAAQGCGGKTSVESEAAGGTSSASGGMGNTGVPSQVCPGDCASDAQFFCDVVDPENMNCHCDSAAPLAANQCASPWHYQCTGTLPRSCTGNVIIIGPRALGCRCDPRALTPEHCASTSQFVCTAYSPAPVDCRCDPAAPKSAADCISPTHYLCESYSPDIACRCAEVLPIR